ncbi:hypothetical protein Zm00014a_041908 [Zea mays]|uniref:AT-hook motif nuclear-localized protein n=2 Tax=Zea mays TaxID=4577 RepID=A0A3L6D8J8_MAIZE|nr:AT-hook motif nuclear-localized protein 10 [Zea mays]PWZ04836.1 hypothetical protein Zm00014a_041908 [Zea mays]PWZ04837.1 hypothetical protein Zm00014a_041908 [Zea mays]
METKDVSPLAAAAAAPVLAPASQQQQQPPQPQQHHHQPPQPQHQHQPPLPPFAQQAAPAAASSPAASMPGGMRLSFDHMPGKAPGEQHHHHHHAAPPMLYAAPPQGAAGAPGGSVLGMGELMRKKRGRPRKYAPDGSMALALAPISSASAGGGGGAAAPGQQQQHGGFSIGSPPSDPSAKRRGRPPGSGKKKQFEALGSWGIAFTPHILAVKAGEVRFTDLVQLPYGRFEIISLSGSFLLAEDGDTRSRTGGLSVALAGSDGRVLGGCVAGMLMAATPVQVVVASFIAEGKKSKPAEARKVEPMAAPPPPPPQMAAFVPAPVATSPPSEGTSSASSDDSGSPINHGAMPFSHSSQHQHPHQHQQHMPPAYASGGWSLSVHQQNRHDSDMKMMSN